MMLRGLTRLHYVYKVQAKQLSTSAPKHSINQHLGGRKNSGFSTQHGARRLFSDGQAPSLSSATTASTVTEGTFSQQAEVSKFSLVPDGIYGLHRRLHL